MSYFIKEMILSGFQVRTIADCGTYGRGRSSGSGASGSGNGYGYGQVAGRTIRGYGSGPESSGAPPGSGYGHGYSLGCGGGFFTKEKIYNPIVFK